MLLRRPPSTGCARHRCSPRTPPSLRAPRAVRDRMPCIACRCSPSTLQRPPAPRALAGRPASAQSRAAARSGTVAAPGARGDSRSSAEHCWAYAARRLVRVRSLTVHSRRTAQLGARGSPPGAQACARARPRCRQCLADCAGALSDREQHLLLIAFIGQAGMPEQLPMQLAAVRPGGGCAARFAAGPTCSRAHAARARRAGSCAVALLPSELLSTGSLAGSRIWASGACGHGTERARAPTQQPAQRCWLRARLRCPAPSAAAARARRAARAPARRPAARRWAWASTARRARSPARGRAAWRPTRPPCWRCSRRALPCRAHAAPAPMCRRPSTSSTREAGA